MILHVLTIVITENHSYLQLTLKPNPNHNSIVSTHCQLG